MIETIEKKHPIALSQNSTDKRKKYMKSSLKEQIYQNHSIPELIHLEADRCECLRYGNSSSPSCVYFPHSDTLYCFKCGEKMDYIKVYAILNRMTWNDALYELAEHDGITVGNHDKQFYQMKKQIQAIWIEFLEQCVNHEKLTGKYGFQIMKTRGFTKEMISQAKIGYCDSSVQSYMEDIYSKELLFEAGFLNLKGNWLFEKRIVFPYLDYKQNPGYFIFRKIDQDPDFMPAKYIKLKIKIKYSKEKESEYDPELLKYVRQNYDLSNRRIQRHFVHEIPYGLYSIYRQDSKPLIITEGITDAISVIQAGYPCLSPVTVRIKKSDIQKIVRYCKRFEKAVVINDNEEYKQYESEIQNPGLKGAEDTLEVLLRNGIHAYLGIIPNPNKLEKIDLDVYLKPEFLDNIRNEKIVETIEENLYKQEEKLDSLVIDAHEGFQYLCSQIPKDCTEDERIILLFELAMSRSIGFRKQLKRKLAGKCVNYGLHELNTLENKAEESAMYYGFEKDPNRNNGTGGESEEDKVLLCFQSDTYHGDPKYTMLRTDGIFSFVEKYNKKTGEFYKDQFKPMWAWEKFEILCRLIDDRTEERKELFNFIYDSYTYEEKRFEEMWDIVYKTSCFESSNKQIFGPLIYQYMKKSDIPERILREVCGWTEEDGWVFPPEYYIAFNDGIQRKFKANIKKMYLTEIDKELIRKRFRNLYNVIRVSHRDYIFAYAVVAPFFYALLPRTKLSPFLAMHSPGGDTGKSSMLELVTEIFWNTMKITKNNYESISRARDYFSNSSLPTGIDDVDDIENNTKSGDFSATMKSITTGRSRAQVKNRDQSLKMDKPFCSSPIFTFNRAPEFFNEPAVPTRGLILSMNKKLEYKDKKLWNKYLHQIKKGEIGKLIIQETRDLTYDDLVELYEKQPNLKNVDKELGIRVHTIYKLLHLGKELFKRIFGIDLDLTELPSLIEQSRQFGSDDIFSLIEVQLHEASVTDPKSFTPRKPRSWFGSPVIETEHKGEWGYIYHTDCLQDLKNRLKTHISGVPELREILKKRWFVSEYKVIKSNGISYRGIFIPRNYEKPKPLTNDELPFDPLEGDENKEEEDNTDGKAARIDVDKVVRSDSEEEEKENDEVRETTTIHADINGDSCAELIVRTLKERLEKSKDISAVPGETLVLAVKSEYSMNRIDATLDRLKKNKVLCQDEFGKYSFEKTKGEKTEKKNQRRKKGRKKERKKEYKTTDDLVTLVKDEGMAFSESDTRTAFNLIKETFEENQFKALPQEDVCARLEIESFSSVEEFTNYFILFLKKHKILEHGKTDKVMLNQTWKRGGV